MRTLISAQITFVNGDYRYYSERTDATGSGISTDSNYLANLRFGIGNPDSWLVELFANNLTDEEEVIAVAFSTIATRPRPREIGLAFTKHF